jgi:hypothetical protein
MLRRLAERSAEACALASLACADSGGVALSTLRIAPRRPRSDSTASSSHADTPLVNSALGASPAASRSTNLRAFSGEQSK